MAYQSQACRDRTEIIDWIEGQPSVPDRKEVRKAFPNTPQKLIRAALASVQARRENE